MNNLIIVQIFKAIKNASYKKSSLFLIKSSFSTDMVTQVSARHIIHDQIQGIAVLKSMQHIDQKRVFEFGQ